MKKTSSAPLVCVVAYRGLCTFEFGLCVEVFALSRPELDVSWYRFAVVAAEPGPLAATGAIQISGGKPLSLLRRASLVLMPGWRGADQPVPQPLLSELRRAHSNGARLASICSGAFVLAQTGLLAGRRATTHWRYANALREHPSEPPIRVQPDVLYCDEGDVLTSAGSAAGLDLCLHIVRQDYGVEVANSVARRLVLPAHRSGGQAQFIPRPVDDLRASGDPLAALLDTLRRRLDEPWNVAAIARAAATSPRTLLRRFRAATGESPAAWLTRERVALARELLESGETGVERIAARCGFGSPEALRHHFRRLLGVSPQAYRRSFTAPKPSQHRR